MDTGELRFKVEQIGREQATMKADQQQLRADMKEGFANVSIELSKIGERWMSSGKPNYQLLIGFASLCVVIIGGFVTMMKGPTDDRLARLEVISSAHTAAIPMMMTKEDYKAERDRNFAILQRQLDAQENRTNRNDDLYDHKIDALERRFEDYRNRR